MENYKIDYDSFNKNFISRGNLQHKTGNTFKLFPFTGSANDKGLKDFSNIIGSFMRAVYNIKKANNILYNDVIKDICSGLEFKGELKEEFIRMIRDIYFYGDGSLKCTKLGTFQYANNNNNEIKIANYIVSVLCEKEKILTELNEKIDESSNVLDRYIEKSLPKLKKEDIVKSEYYNFNPNLKTLFTEDICYLIRDSVFDKEEIINLLSYYYFLYTSQTILKINKFFDAKDEIYPVYFCLNWEKTSQNRYCYKFGWNQIDRKLDTLFSHAVLLDMLNTVFHKGEVKNYNYCDFDNLYNNYNEVERINMFNEVKNLRDTYRSYINDFNFLDTSEVEYGDLSTLIKSFYNDILSQFRGSVRKRANDAYKSSFRDFVKNNFLQSRGKSGLMLTFSEEQIVLFTKVVIKNNEKMQLKILFREFEKRGIFFDNISKEGLVEFYDKLGLIEKKSDSGDAKYVKGIL